MISFGRKFAVVALMAILSGCTLLRPPDLPNRAGIVPGERITVKGDGNIYTIARQYNVSMRELIALNSLKAPFELRPGQSLVLPAGGSSFAGEVPTPTSSPLEPVEKNELSPIMPSAVSEQPLEPLPLSTSNVSVKSSPFGAPSLQPSPLIPKGEALSAPATPTAPADQVTALNQPAPVKKMTETTMTSQAPAPSPETSAGDASASLRWPVQGPILSTYGSKGAGMNNDGINIGAPKGAPVVAAAAGTVVYSGDEMKGFGNLVLIKHQGDLVTAYAHLDRVLVKKDAVVAKGDMIGTVGKTGNVAKPQLHFETRLDGKAVDPMTMIKR